MDLLSPLVLGVLLQAPAVALCLEHAMEDSGWYLLPALTSIVSSCLLVSQVQL